MESKIERLLKELTLDEKIGMIHGKGLFETKGVERLGIPPLKLSDGPMGVRNEFPGDSWVPVGNSDDYVSYLPSNSALASTWNRKLAGKCGQVLGEEARGRGKDVILAPGINIKRSSLCGRNFEYMSEDPYLAGEMAVPLIEGIQKADVAACVKHFALNNQETERLWVEVEVSDQALREIYLPAFKKAVKKAGALSLMGAYNRYKGEHCCESKELLTDILRKEWGYDGMVVSDWGAVHDTKKAAESALDLEMSVTYDFDNYCLARPLKEAVEKGEISEGLIDEKVKNILRLMDRLHMLPGEHRQSGSYNTPEHQKTLLKAAEESIVLLKNENHILPLKPERIRKLLVVGDNANRAHSGGGGSAEIKALYEITPLLGIKMLLGGNTRVDFCQGYLADDLLTKEAGWQEESRKDGGGKTAGEKDTDGALLQKQKELREEALRKAALYDQVIFVGGLNHQQDLEGQDRPDMKLPYAQDQLILELLKAKPDTVVVMAAGSPVEMGAWLSRAKALVWNWYAGMEGGKALAEVLFGKVNPSGRLPESFPFSHMDCPAHCIGEFPGGKTVAYREGIFVGYRYYETRQMPVAFPFGYGLSYTEFTYERLKARVKGNGNGAKVQVTLGVVNTGAMKGKEVVQLYVGRKNSGEDRPIRELKAFDKISLKPGEIKNLEFMLDMEAFSYYDEKEKEFRVEKGAYIISVCRSAHEVWMETEVEL